MPTTSNFGWTTPADTDLVKDGALAIRTLGNGIDTSLVDLNGGTSGQILSKNTNTDLDFTWVNSYSSAVQNNIGRNKLANGAMMVAQRGTSYTSTGGANNDDTYVLDRWYVLSDGNDVVDITRATDVPTNGLYSMGLDCETVNKKFGIAQIIEQQNCVGLIGETVTLSFKARTTSTLKFDNFKAAIIAWSGTADTVTSDIISAWNVEGTNPTLIANATYENTPANLNITTSWATYSVTAAVDTASTKNIIVFIWSDVTDTTLGDFLYVTDVQLESGSIASDFVLATGNVQGELAFCQRYYQRVNSNTGQSANQLAYMGLAQSTTSIVNNAYMPVPMRRDPTVLDYASIRVFDGANFITPSALAIDQANNSLAVLASTVTGATQFRPYALVGSASTAYIGLGAEL